MARKLNLDEARAFTEFGGDESMVSDAELALQNLARRRDEALELSPESGMWFGDLFPGTFGPR